MQRSRVGLAAIADWHNLAAAFQRAARGKGERDEVRRFRADLNGELARLRESLLDGSVEVGQMRSFHTRDPKPRIIHAPRFRERVLHHAVMAHVGSVLDRALVDDTYACRAGKGALAAVLRAQHHLRRWPWYAQIDIRSYFASIDHAILLTLLERRFKDRGLLALLARIVESHRAEPGRGLPIGALTSQHFANDYLAGLDRLLLEGCRVRGLVRYMDDLVWWGDGKDAVRDATRTTPTTATTTSAFAVPELATGPEGPNPNRSPSRAFLPDRQNPKAAGVPVAGADAPRTLAGRPSLRHP